jgi:hypothetical protein
MARAATLTCPRCGHVEHPIRHTYNVRCGRAIYWHNGTLQCECGARMGNDFRCDGCGKALGRGDVS